MARLLAGLLAVWVAAGSSAGAPVHTDLVERSRVDVVEAWPFVVNAKKPAYEQACRNLGASDLRIVEGGQEVRVLEVVRALPLTTQLLMIDSSGSMMGTGDVVSRKKGRQAKTAARSYVDWMLEDALAPSIGENVVELVVVTFDDDLLMAVPPTVVSEARTASALKSEIDAIVGGLGTSLYDSLFRLTHYVASRGKRTAVIVLSDGADTSSALSSLNVVESIEETDLLTLFSVFIGYGPTHAALMKQIAELSGGKSYELRNKRPDHLAGTLERMFAEIRTRLKSQLYVSYLTEPAGALVSDGKYVDRQGRIRRGIKIQSLDKRCSVPDGGYRSMRTVEPVTGEDRASSSDRLGKVTRPFSGGNSATIRMPFRDGVVDSGPYLAETDTGPPPGAVDLHPMDELLARSIELVAAPIETDPSAPQRLKVAVERKVEDIVHDWIVAGEAPAPRLINGKAFLDGRFLLAESLFVHLEPYREWLQAKIDNRVRRRYLNRIPPPEDPEERSRYETALEIIVRRAVDAATGRDYQDDVVAWLGDVRARDLSMLVMAKNANLLIAEGDSATEVVDIVQSRWGGLHDWLYFPDTVRVTTPLELSCETERNRCGFYRIVRPRLSELPEDLEQPQGKTAEPSSFEEYSVYHDAKIPRHPFALMLVRWMLGMPRQPSTLPVEPPPERRELADELRARWRVAAVDQSAEEVRIPRERKRAGDAEQPLF